MDEKYSLFKYNDKTLRSVRTEHPIDPDTGTKSVKDDRIIISYPRDSEGLDKLELSISDTFFYGKDIKPGLAKFMVLEIRKMVLTQEIIENPDLLKSLYRRLYKIQAMILGEVKLNPTNHRFFSG
ncbi:MAG: hypothetical protein ABIQ95_15705 [Bdellovibrionia bacterium]